VLGKGGSGTSTVAMAAAQGMASDADHDGAVVLADLARRADLALLHDAGDVVPGVQELVEAHRTHALSSDDVRRLAFGCPDRGYHLLLGLRRARDWAVLRPRAFEAAFEGLQRSYRVVVADVDADLEGEAECGSIDVEERNLMARTAVARADVVVVVSTATVTGVHRLARLVDEALRFGVDAARVLPIVNRAPRAPRQRSEIAGALAHAINALRGAPAEVASPLFLVERRRLDDLQRDGVPMPRQLVEPVTRAVEAMLERCAPRATAAPQPVKVGRMGSWHGHD
jgi:MinD-like ATPase involved in chromosome partitioning or flagellar assembly